ncbi:MAG: alkaline phosphatase [Pseudobdellovibrionaceae bacterium]
MSDKLQWQRWIQEVNLIFLTVLVSFFGNSLAFANSHSAIFFHPDGMSVSHWTAVRMMKVGPDGELNWDRLARAAVYKGHMKDQLSGTSNGGATVHAYGIKVGAESFGNDNGKAIVSANGKGFSLLTEALKAGKSTALIQSGHLAEPGTAVFVASVESRRQYEEIVSQVVASGVEVILGGGEKYLLPLGKKGRFGEGTRKDGRDLIAEAQAQGYTVVFTKSDLSAAAKNPQIKKVLGVFAADHTFNDLPEKELKKKNLPHYWPEAPTIAEMAEATLQIVSRNKKGFFIVAEEEGTDNFSNENNAAGFLEAGLRADEALGVFLKFVEKNKKTLLLTTSDSDAGGLQVWGSAKMDPKKELAAKAENGSPLDGPQGSESVPFMAKPDQFGVTYPFAISWANFQDSTGGILLKGQGPGSEKLKGTVDNTMVFRLISDWIFKK